MGTLSEPRDEERPGEDHVLAVVAAAKLGPPWSRPGVVPRRALVERLQTSSSPIITVVAPAGYGKTTLLSQWLSASSYPSAWVSLDRNDNDPGLLLSYLLAALDQIEPIDPGVGRSLLAWASNDLPRSLRGLAGLVSSMPAPFGLVLDHVEVVQNPACADVITELALNVPPAARVALASRVDPPLPMARLQARGWVTALGPSDLAMDLGEAKQLAAGVSVDLGEEEVSALLAHTEGWPVALYLASSSLATGRGSEKAAPASWTDERLVVDYVRDEILASLPPAHLTFLTRTSVLDHLSGPLCDAVLATSGSESVLEAIAESSSLVVPVAGRRQWYRCHHLLREQLQAELERSEPEMVSRFNDRAATWFEAEGEPSVAVDHAQAAGDTDRAARLFAEVAVPIHSAGRADTIARWLRWFEARDVVSQYPCVAVLGALAEALNGHRASAALFADAAASGSPHGIGPDGSPIVSWLCFMNALLCRHGVGQMRSDASDALSGLSLGSPFRPPALLFAGLGALLQGDDTAADRHLADCAELGLRAGQFPTTALALAERAVLAIDGGDWRRAGELSDQAVATFERGSAESYAQAVSVYAVAARVSVHRGDLETARTWVVLASRARPACTSAVPCTAQFLPQLAHAYLALGDPAGARAVLRQFRELLRDAPDLGILPEQGAALQRTLDTIGVGAVGASSLTAAELRLLPLLATHLSYQDIGERLYVSRNTIKSEAGSLFRKLGASSRSEAVVLAERIGLLEPTTPARQRDVP
jgi:LuxR family maltose regulon positive regulatory protein